MRPAITIDWENQGRLWARPAAAALVTLFACYVLAVILGAIVVALGGGSGVSVADYLRLGGLVLLLSHHVSLNETVRVDQFDSAHFSTTFAPLGFTIVIVTILFLAGKRAAARAPSSRWQALWTGLRLSVVYALGCLLVCVVTRVSSSGSTLEPSVAGSFFVPFVWALFASSAGAFGAVANRPLAAAVTRAEQRVPQGRAALKGARAGLLASVLLEVLALLIVILVASALHPSAAGDFFTSPRDVLTLAFFLVVCLPNWMGLGMVAAMGASLRFTISAASAYGVVSVSIFGASGHLQGVASQSAHVPAYWLLALLVPTAVLLYTGYAAAKASTGDARDRTISGALAGLLLTVALWITLVLSSLGLRGQTGVGFSLTLSASTVGSIFLPPLWGILAGTIGAQMFVSRQAPRAVPVQAAAGSVAPTWDARPDQGVPSPYPRDVSEAAWSPPSPAAGPPPGPPDEREDSTTILPRTPAPGWRAAPQIFCTGCGAANASHYRYCQRCGRTLENSIPQ